MKKMIRTNKWKLIVSSIVILLPALAGAIMWDMLPEKMPIHFGADGNADRWGGKLFTITVIPAIILILHWVCLLATFADPKNRDQTKKALGMIFWICPIISVLASVIIYAMSLGIDLSVSFIVTILAGIMFVLIGNYLPKCKQNHTFGIRIKWTLENEENWNATHRFCGKIMVCGGFLTMACVFLPKAVIPYVLIAILVTLILITLIYSYVYHRKHLRAGTEKK